MSLKIDKILAKFLSEFDHLDRPVSFFMKEFAEDIAKTKG